MLNYFWGAQDGQPATSSGTGQKQQKLDEGWFELESNRSLLISGLPPNPSATGLPQTAPNAIDSKPPSFTTVPASSVSTTTATAATIPSVIAPLPIVQATTVVPSGTKSTIPPTLQTTSKPSTSSPTTTTATAENRTSVSMASTFFGFGAANTTTDLKKPEAIASKTETKPATSFFSFIGGNEPEPEISDFSQSYILRPSLDASRYQLGAEKTGFQKLTAFQYTLGVTIIATLFLSWFMLENWELLVGASLLTFWAAILGIMVIVFPLYSSALDVHLHHRHFHRTCGTFQVSASGELLSQLRPNKWLSVVLKTMLVQLTGIEFENVDLGASSPSLSCLHIEDEKNRPNGFNTVQYAWIANTCQDMIMRYAYDTGSDTHLTVRVPIPVPRYGTVTLPVSVAAPCISGKVRLDGRFETCSFDTLEAVLGEDGKLSYKPVRKSEKFFALALGFDQIDKILIGEIQIMNAPKWEWIQSFETVKAQMKSLVNDCLKTAEVNVILFDASFVFIGTTTRKRLRDMDIPTKPTNNPTVYTAKQNADNSDCVITDDGWTVQDVVDDMKVCYKCHMKFLPDFYGCCCEREHSGSVSGPSSEKEPVSTTASTSESNVPTQSTSMPVPSTSAHTSTETKVLSGVASDLPTVSSTLKSFRIDSNYLDKTPAKTSATPPTVEEKDGVMSDSNLPSYILQARGQSPKESKTDLFGDFVKVAKDEEKEVSEESESESGNDLPQLVL